jgi:hypothetical protein
MEQGNSSMRDRLLARLPQPENLAAYREETESLLASHEKALRTNRYSGFALWLSAVAILALTNSIWSPDLAPMAIDGLHFLVGLMAIAGVMTGVESLVDRSKVDLLKEIKQLQLQVLEVQASLRNSGTNKI